MSRPTLHVIGLAHTRPTDQFSHCAFTGKVKRLGPMMVKEGFETIHYGVEGAVGFSSTVDLLTKDEQETLIGEDPSRGMYAFHNVRVDSPVYMAFNNRLRAALNERVKPGDLVLHTFGDASAHWTTEHKGINVESGIGYDNPWSQYRIFESYAWLHRNHGRKSRDAQSNPGFYEWVIPNYYDHTEWPIGPGGDYVLFMGRITEAKGIGIARDIAKFRPDLKIVIAGQGDPGPWCTELNMEYIGPIHGKSRATWIGNAKAVIAPSMYLEPFGGIAVEAMMAGTPVIATPWGAFTETIEHGKTGFRCRTMPEFLRAVDMSSALDRHYIASYARSKWDVSVVGPQYAMAFDMIHDLNNGGGWYSFPGEAR